MSRELPDCTLLETFVHRMSVPPITITSQDAMTQQRLAAPRGRDKIACLEILRGGFPALAEANAHHASDGQRQRRGKPRRRQCASRNTAPVAICVR